MKATGALITKEADTMSVMKFRMNNADRALWLDMKFTRTRELQKERKTKGTENWCSGAFITHVKAGDGTKK